MVPGAFVGTRLSPLNPFRKSVYGKKSSVGQGGDVVEKYFPGQKDTSVSLLLEVGGYSTR